MPNDRITGVTVYNDDATALSALDGLYSQLFNTSFAAGGNQSVTFLAGLSSDDFVIASPFEEMIEFAENEIFPSNTYNLNLWGGAYSTVYMANALMEGVEGSTELGADTQDQILGGTKFVRAFTYFYLAQLYGEVPLVLTPDYEENATAASATSQQIYDQILTDLGEALELLGPDYPQDERTYANQYTVMALLARVHLFLENWEQAEFYSDQVISASGTYGLLDDLDQVFLPNSQEAIWQISPAGWGSGLTHTREGNLFIRETSTGSPVELSESLMSLWEGGDLRLQQWIGNYTDDTGSYDFPYKYKVRYDASGGDIPEYSMVLRLAEQYLIRAEARASMGNLSGAIADVDKIRARADIPLLDEEESGIAENELLDIILLERRKEFFAEWGHRWLDLKRTDKVDEVIGSNNALWQPTDELYPIPEDERMRNPNLGQNDGY